MIRNFFSTPNIIGKLMIALLFVGGVVYAGAFDGFVVETEASICCGGGTDTEHFSSSSCCGTKCNCIPGKTCGCGNNPTCGNSTSTDVCPRKCCNPSTDTCCDGTRCVNDSRCAGDCDAS